MGQYTKSPTHNVGTVCGISSETKLWNFPWNFHRNFHRDKTVEFSVEIPKEALQRQICLVSSPAQRTDCPVEIPQKVPQFCFRGISCGISTKKFHEFVSVEHSLEFSREIPRFCLSGILHGNSKESSMVLFLWKFQRKFHQFVSCFLDTARNCIITNMFKMNAQSWSDVEKFWRI